MAGVVLFILAALGLALIARGIAGRRVGQEPRCRKCRYDLSGIEQKANSCPECGSSLTPTRAIVQGLKKRRLASLAAGLLITATTAGLVGVNVWAKANDFDFNTVKPTWLLLTELERNNKWNDRLKIDEIARRLTAGSLSDPNIDRLARSILDAHQSQDSGPQPSGKSSCWSECFNALLVHPNTPITTRSQLIAFAIETLQQQSISTTNAGSTTPSLEVFSELNHLMATRQMSDQQIQSFIPLTLRPKIRTWNDLEEGNKSISARLTINWSSNYQLISSAIPRWGWVSPWGVPVLEQPALFIECNPLAGECDITSARPQSWVVTPGRMIYDPFNSAPETDQANSIMPIRGWSRSKLSNQRVGYIQIPRLPGNYVGKFELRATLLESDPAASTGYLRPTAACIVVIQQVEVPLIVKPKDETTTLQSSPIPGR